MKGAWLLSNRTTRYTELDALRGLAAFFVLTFHFFQLEGIAGLWCYTPFYSGVEAVVFFFVLSGFVLSLPFYAGDVPPLPFWARRICRIWLPYAVMVGGYCLCLALLPNAVTALWGRPSGLVIFQHLVLIDSFNVNAFNGVVWSLVHELRISLAFPFLMYCWGRLSAGRTLVWSLALSVVGLALNRLSAKLGLTNDVFLSLHYVLMFAVGALLARHRERLVVGWEALPGWRRGLVFGGAGLVFVSAKELPALFSPSFAGDLWLQWPVVGSVAVIIIAALSAGRLQQALQTRPLQFLGRISYSLYLYHLMVLKMLVDRAAPLLPMPLLLVACVVLSLAIATASFYLVERPSTRLGYALARRLGAKSVGARKCKPAP